MSAEISIKAEELVRLAGVPITNALLLAWIALGVLVGLGAALHRQLALVPGRFQSVFEVVLEQILQLMDSVLGSRAISEKYLPLVATIFLFIVTSNWLGLLPGIGTISFTPLNPALGEHAGVPVPLLRAPASDLNFTIALAVISVVGVNVLGSAAIGLRHHLHKFFNFSSPVNFFVGILEFISEFIKIVSFSFRLFGNVFAGEVLLTIVGVLVPYLLPLPFIFLEIFVGFIQGFIFAMLTLVFIGMAVNEQAAH